MELTKNQWLIAIIVVVIVIIIIVIYYRSRCKNDKILVENTVKNIEVPKNFKTETGDGIVNITWDPVPNASNYTVLFSPEKDFPEDKVKRIVQIPQAKLQIGKMPVGNYYFKVKAVKKAAKGAKDKTDVESEYTEPEHAQITLCSPPEPPKKVELTKNSSDVEINWTQSANADGYYIYVNNDADPNGDDNDHAVIKVDNPNTKSHILKDIPEGFSWHVAVRPFGKHCGNGLLSDVKVIET